MNLKCIAVLLLILKCATNSGLYQLSWPRLLFETAPPSRPHCSYVEFLKDKLSKQNGSSCWNKNLANDVELAFITNDERLELREKVREMFYFGYDNYMTHAFPLDELNPIYCSGRGSDKDRPDNINVNDALGDYMLTLVDSLDTLAVVGDVEGFKHAVGLVVNYLSYPATNVQVFESTIRIIGGLLSAHLIMSHPDRVKFFGNDFRPRDYDDELLSLARELGVRLLPAFENTPHGIPWPRVNLHHGVLKNCSEETATAGAGTLLLEFGILSKLTGDPVFEMAARRAVRQIYKLRNAKTGLLGSVVNMKTGEFTNQMSGVGAGLDSFFEYLLKAHILFSSNRHGLDHEMADMYDTLMSSVRQYLRLGRPLCHRGFGTTPLYVNVDMRNGDMANNWIDSLQAAFPAILTLSGEVHEAICQHSIYSAIWRRYGVLPERFNFRLKVPEVKFYPLRPEFAESTYLLYQATRNPYYLAVGRLIVDNLNDHCKAKCGYATVHNVETMELEDRQESFFLSETVKYLYLLFDTGHSLNKFAERIIFTTEGHVVPIGQWVRASLDENPSRQHVGKSKRKRQRPPWLRPANNSTITSLGANFLLTKIPVSLGAVSSRSCEFVNDLRHLIAPLDIRFLQQIDAEVGLER